MSRQITPAVGWAAFLLATALGMQAAAEDNGAPRTGCAAAECRPEIGRTLRGDYNEFRAYSLYDLRRPPEGERDLRIDETLYRVDAGDLTILHIIPLTEIVLN